MILFAWTTGTMEPELLKWFATLGVGGILAGIMFYVYRQREKDHATHIAESEKEHLARMVESQQRFAEMSENFRDIVEENTKALTQLSVALEGKICPYEKLLEREFMMMEAARERVRNKG